MMGCNALHAPDLIRGPMPPSKRPRIASGAWFDLEPTL